MRSSLCLNVGASCCSNPCFKCVVMPHDSVTCWLILVGCLDRGTCTRPCLLPSTMPTLPSDDAMVGPVYRCLARAHRTRHIVTGYAGAGGRSESCPICPIRKKKRSFNPTPQRSTGHLCTGGSSNTHHDDIFHNGCKNHCDKHKEPLCLWLPSKLFHMMGVRARALGGLPVFICLPAVPDYVGRA